MSRMTIKDLKRILELLPDETVISGISCSEVAYGGVATNREYIECPDIETFLSSCWGTKGHEDFGMLSSDNFEINDCRKIDTLPEEHRNIEIVFGEF